MYILHIHSEKYAEEELKRFTYFMEELISDYGDISIADVEGFIADNSDFNDGVLFRFEPSEGVVVPKDKTSYGWRTISENALFRNNARSYTIAFGTPIKLYRKESPAIPDNLTLIYNNNELIVYEGRRREHAIQTIVGDEAVAIMKLLTTKPEETENETDQ
jgi:hypothetical protein